MAVPALSVQSMLDAEHYDHCMTARIMLAAASMTAVPSYCASLSDPAVRQVQTLTTALLKSMQAGAGQSVSGRFNNLEPVIEQVFSLPLVTQLCVGPEWASFSAAQQTAAIAAFTRFTTANYVDRFRESDGKRFEIDEHVASRGGEKIVSTRLIPLHDTPVNLLYRMREVDGNWKVIDVYSDGISELALRRSDFASAIADGGAARLIAYLNRASDTLMK
jgi:phospholipid transport system substrate-binding protein